MANKIGLKGIFSFFTLVLLTGIPLFYNNCTSKVQFTGPKTYGTVTGNPMNPPQASSEILFAICSVLDRCQGQVPFNTCMSGVLATNGIGATLGLPAGTYDPYSSIETAEASGTITVNLNNANTCVDTINTLSCSSPSVINAYNPSNSNPFAGVPNMIPAQACGQVFSNTYEYIYFGDQNNANLMGYAINTSSGVLTEIPNTPASLGRGLVVGKIASDAQLLVANNAAFWINPTTGILNPVTGGGFLSGNGPEPAAFSPSGLYLYDIDGSGSKAWVASVNPTAGSLSDVSETSQFPAPITKAWGALVSPDGNYVYFIDPYNNAIAGYSTSGGALTILAGAGSGTGVNPGNQTYGLTLLPSPNAGNYNRYSAPYLDSGAGVIYLFYVGATGSDNNWIVPYKINSDGSLSTGTPLNVGTNPGFGDYGAMVGDATGKYLFVDLPGGTLGINTYSIGVNGSLTYSSGPVFAGGSFSEILINSENTLIYGNSNNVVTASINLATGVLTPVSSVADPCGNLGPMSLDLSEGFVYTVNHNVSPNTVCGFTVDAVGAIGKISTQSYPLSIPGSGSIVGSVTVKITSP